MRNILLAMAPVAMLAACSGGGDADSDGDGEISEEEAAAEAEAADVSIRPGEWEATVQMTEFDIPNLPPEAREMIQRQMAEQRTSTSCITPEEAANPQAGMFGNQNDECTYTDFDMSGGNMLIAGTCESPDGPRGTIRMEGTYTETSYEMSVSTTIENGPTGRMQISGDVSGRHVADECTDS